MKKIPPEALELIRDGVASAGSAAAMAIEREAQRRRDEACLEHLAMERRLARLPRWRWLARVLARRRRNVAADYCGA